MAGRTVEAEPIPLLLDLIAAMGRCWRTVRETQSKVDRHGPTHRALDEVGAGLEDLAHHLTGQHGFFVLAPPTDLGTFRDDGVPHP